jgi:phosphosulfolactate synthase (CoM biosynthesis protein A)
MEKEQNVIIGQDFVKKHNDTIKKFVDTAILGWGGKRLVQNIKHQKKISDVHDNKIHLFVWGHLQK